MMIKNERKEQIVNLLTMHKHATVDFLVHELHYSPATIRRDLTELANAGILKKSYGGVSLNEFEKSVAVREHEFVEEKKNICVEAAKLIGDHDVIFIAGSSTTHILARLLTEKRGITVVTSDMKLALYFGEKGISCYCVGGKVADGMVIGYHAVNAIKQFHFDTCVFSVSALSDLGEMTSPSMDFAEMIKEVLPRSKTSVCLCVSKRFGSELLAGYGTLDDVDYFVSDRPLPASLMEKYSKTRYQSI